MTDSESSHTQNIGEQKHSLTLLPCSFRVLDLSPFVENQSALEGLPGTTEESHPVCDDNTPRSISRRKAWNHLTNSTMLNFPLS
jgi:hypothetical protein